MPPNPLGVHMEMARDAPPQGTSVVRGDITKCGARPTVVGTLGVVIALRTATVLLTQYLPIPSA